MSRRAPLVVKTRTATAIARINTASATKPDVCMRRTMKRLRGGSHPAVSPVTDMSRPRFVPDSGSRLLAQSIEQAQVDGAGRLAADRHLVALHRRHGLRPEDAVDRSGIVP